MKLSKLSKIFKALSNDQRLRIFAMIFRECCVPEGREGGSKFPVKGGSCCPAAGGIEKAFTKMCDCINLSRSTISHHFKELQNAGLIICKREGQTYRCRINEKAVDSIKEFFR